MKTRNQFLRWPLLLVLLNCLFVFPACKFFKELNISNRNDVYHRPYADSQVVIWKDPTTSADFDSLIRGYMNADPGMSRIECGSCDNNMVILQSASLANGGGLVGQLASNSPTGDIKPSGGGPIAYWSFNYYMIANDPVNKKIGDNKKVTTQRPYQPSNTDSDVDPVVVAVFDSGIDPAYVNAASANYSSTTAGCIAVGSNNGWNIADNNSDVTDLYAYPHGHGKHVAALSMQTSAKANLSPIKILPIKFISSDNPTLYDVLCGIAYARDRGADIINASFGYYASKTPGIGAPGNEMFKKFLQYYTMGDSTQKKIIVVAAAGNEDDVQQLTNCGMISRNLDDVYFFPASFAGSPGMNNIIVVTTVGEDGEFKVSPRQNYSSQIVSVGVKADRIQNNKEYLIETPYYNNTYIQGSSYATPLFSGLLSAYLGKIKVAHPGNYFDRETILSFLTDSSVVSSKPSLLPYIKNGLYIEH